MDTPANVTSSSVLTATVAAPQVACTAPPLMIGNLKSYLHRNNEYGMYAVIMHNKVIMIMAS